MTQAGTPCIYYGSEIGLDGGADPLCRKCMIWDKDSQDREMFDYLKQLIHLRKTYKALSSSELEWIQASDTGSYLIFKKQLNDEIIYVILNNNNKSQLINLSSLPEGVYTELLTNTEVSMKATLPVKPYTAWILKKI